MIATNIVNRKLNAKLAVQSAVKLAFEKFSITDEQLVARSNPVPSPPAPPVDPNAGPTAWQQGVANSKRVASGILNTAASGAGELLTAVPYGANEVWNTVTPKNWNTSQIYSDTVKNLYHIFRANTDAAAADVYNGLGGDSNYFAPTASERNVARTLEMPNPDGLVARVARASNNIGDEAFNAAQAVVTMNGAAGVARFLPGASRAATAANNAYRAASPAVQRFADGARTATAYATGAPIARVNPIGLMGSLYAQRAVDAGLRGQDMRLQNAGVDSNLSQWADLLPVNAIPNLATATVGPEAANYATQLAMVPTLGTNLASATYHVGYPALTEVINLTQPAQSPEQLQAQHDALLQINTPNNSVPQPLVTPGDQPAPSVAASPVQPASPRRPFDLDPAEDAATPARPPRRPFDVDPTEEISSLPSTTTTTTADTTTTPAAQVDSTPAAPATAPLTTTDTPLPGVPADASPKELEATASEAARLAELKKENPGIAAAVADPTSEEGQQIAADGQKKMEQQLSADYAARKPPPTNPQDFGQWLSGMTTYIGEMWESLGPMGQIAFGLGVPIGLIGLMGDGVGSFLTAAIGLGAAGTALASSGAFGETVQKGTNDTLGNVSSTAANITGNKPTASGSLSNNAAGSNANPEFTGNDDAQLLTQMANTWTLKSFVTENKDALIKLLSKSDEELIDVLRGLDSTTQGHLRTQLKRIAEHDADDPKTSQNENDVVKPQVSRAMGLLNHVMTQKTSSAYVRDNLMPKIARCWKGYEPVPGKKPYTDGSCRPAGGKKKQKQMKKKSASDTYALAPSNKLLNTIRGYYVKQAYTQSIKVSKKGRSKTSA